MSDPTDLQALDRIKFQAQATVDPVVVEHDKLLKAVERVNKSASDQLSAMVGDGLDEMEAEVADESAAKVDTNAEVDDAPVVKFLQKILMDAINGGASDIHFEPYEKFYRIRYRVDGELREVAQPPIAIKEKLASRIKVISRLDISEKRIPQDGRMKLVLSATRAIDFRVSTLPTLFGEKIVMRILDPSSAKLGIDALGYDPDQKEHLLNAVQRPLRHGARHRPDRLGQDGVALHLPEHPEQARREHRPRPRIRRRSTCPASTRSTSATRPA